MTRSEAAKEAWAKRREFYRAAFDKARKAYRDNPTLKNYRKLVVASRRAML